MSLIPWPELEPASRAIFLKLAWDSTPQDFENVTPDQMLLNELGEAGYLKLKDSNLVPICAIPAAIMQAS